MDGSDPLELFFAAPPGLEALLAEEARSLAFQGVRETAGGVIARGDWAAVQRANLHLRGAGRVLARIGSARVSHLSQLDKWARRLPWETVLRSDVPVRVEARTAKSRIYHSGAAAERIERAIAERVGAPILSGAAEVETISVLARIERDVCTVSVDSSGAPLHQRGFKQWVGKAPLRETLAALFLRACGYAGGETVVDPMCGSGSFVIEAAEMAAGLAPGRGRRFAFERLAGFDAEGWAAMRAADPTDGSAAQAFGFDRDAGAIEGARGNAERAGVSSRARFVQQAVSALEPPDGPPGLVITNPPYGARIGAGGRLEALYGALGETLKARFSGWRVGMVTSETKLARATRLPFGPPGPPIPHGALRIRLFKTAPLP